MPIPLLLPLILALNATSAAPLLSTSTMLAGPAGQHRRQPTGALPVVADSHREKARIRLDRLVSQQRPRLKKSAIARALSTDLAAYRLALTTELTGQRRRQLAAIPPWLNNRQGKPGRSGLRPCPTLGFISPPPGKSREQGGIYGLRPALSSTIFPNPGNKHAFF